MATSLTADLESIMTTPLTADLTAVNLSFSTTATTDAGSQYARVGATKTISITCNQDISAKTLVVTVETLRSKTDIAAVLDGAITKATTTASFALTTAMTVSERTLRLTVRDTTTLEDYASINLFVTYDAQGD